MGRRVGKEGDTTVRQHLEALAKRGDPRAIAELEGPEMPEAVEYIWRWIWDLHGRSGVGPDGYAPLRYAEVEAWARLTGQEITHYEVGALMMLDSVLLERNTPNEPGE